MYITLEESTHDLLFMPLVYFYARNSFTYQPFPAASAAQRVAPRPRFVSESLPADAADWCLCRQQLPARPVVNPCSAPASLAVLV